MVLPAACGLTGCASDVGLGEKLDSNGTHKALSNVDREVTKWTAVVHPMDEEEAQAQGSVDEEEVPDYELQLPVFNSKKGCFCFQVLTGL